MKIVRERLSYANVVATAALFIALGGSAYAIDKIGSKDIARNAVKSKHVKGKAVKTKHIARGAVKKHKLAKDAVNTRKVLDGSLLAADFALGELPQGEQGDTGPQGETGPQGPKGDTGPQGGDGADGSPDTPNQVLSKLKEVDGSGSGLDADLLDGRDSVQFARFAGFINQAGATTQGEGFTSSRTDLGTYKIVLPPGTYSGCRYPLAVATLFGGAGSATIHQTACQGNGGGSFTVKTWDGAGALVDRGFFFIAY